MRESPRGVVQPDRVLTQLCAVPDEVAPYRTPCLLAGGNQGVRRWQRRGAGQLKRLGILQAKTPCQSERPGQRCFPSPPLLLLLDGLHPLVRGQQRTLGLNQLISRLPELPGEQLAAS